ncbi:MAG: hypothetical protein HY244_01485 [Rhizobiales bacterium]|nr:hypothetical protein [Hyphomicrobiales bacterium]
MSTLRKMLEDKKAAILADAQRRAAEVDADMDQLEKLTAKYGLEISTGANGTPVGAAVSDIVAKTLADLGNASPSAKVKAGAEAYIRSKNRPVPLGELFEMLDQHGLKFKGDTPRNTLSAILGQNENLYSISRERGWWLKDVEVPHRPVIRRVI